MGQPVEHHMFPDLVADGDGIMADAEAREERQILAP
jgi:hypothetical protein